MTSRVRSGAVADAASVTLVHEPVAADQIVSGSPTIGIHELDDVRWVWEMDETLHKVSLAP